METINLECSFDDDDDDVYLNSVTKLKALQKQSAQPNKKTKDKQKDAETNIEAMVKKRPNRRVKSRTKTSSRRQKQSEVVQELDSDVEVVSVEEMPNSSQNDAISAETCRESSEDENYDITIKILWRSKDMHRLNIQRNENFRKIFEHFANLEQVSTDEILITKKDKIIAKNDTPTTINWSVIDILEGGIIKKDSGMLKKNSEEKDEDACTIKVQTTTKKSIIVSVKQDDDFKALIAKCAQELNVNASKIKLYFDGELVAVTDTPSSLEIEDEACFDLRLSS